MTKNPVQTGTDWAELWIAEARGRLDIAKIHTEPHDRRPFCEQAHYAAEYTIIAVLVSQEIRPETTHDIGVLFNQLEDAGKKIPKDLQGAKMLTQFAGAARYKFARSNTPRPTQSAPVTQAQYERAVEVAEKVFDWGRKRVQELQNSQQDRSNPRTESEIAPVRGEEYEAGGATPATIPEKGHAKRR